VAAGGKPAASWEDGVVETADSAARNPIPGTSAAAEPARAEAPRVRQSERTPKDMALSLLVLLVPIALFVVFHQVVLDGNEPTVADPEPVIAQARSAGAFPISEPVGLDPDWRPVTAKFQRNEDGQTLRLGYLAPSGKGVQVVQSNMPADRLLPIELTDESQPRGVVELSGRTWQRYQARAGERALVLLEPHRTVIVIGSVDEHELRHLAGALT
jgi:hypothetical protein